MPRSLMAARFRPVRFLPWLVLAALLATTYYLARDARYETGKQLQASFDLRVRGVKERIEQRLLAYEQILRGAQGLFAASSGVKRDAFQTYVANQHLEESYPGIQGVGFSLIVPPAEKNQHIATIRKESGHSEYLIRPEGERGIYTSIIYLEPFGGRNLRAFGYDMYSEPVRRAAMEQARDSGRASLSGKVELVQETGQNVQSGFLMYLPVYKNGAPHDTVAERRANIAGWVYAPFRMDDLMHGIRRNRANEFDVGIYDGDGIADQAMMYDADNNPDGRLHARFQTVTSLDIAGHRWTLLIHSYPPFEERLETHEAEFIAWGGTAASLLLALLTWSLVRGRERAEQAAHKMNRELIQSEARARLAISASRAALYDYDLATGRVYLSEAWSEFLGGEQHPIHTTIQELTALVPEEERDMVRAAIVEAIKGHGSSSYQVTHRVKKPDGGYIWVLSEGHITERDQNGRALRMTGFNRDVTERKQAEIALRDSEQRFRAIIEASPIPYALNDDQQNITYLNTAFTRTFGYTLADIPTLADWWPKAYPDPAYRQRAVTDWQSHLDKARQENKPFEPLELDIRCKDGTLRTALVGAAPIGASFGGAHLVTLYDITERKQAEDMLRKLSIAVEQSPASVVITDPRARIQYVNPRFTEVTGYSAAEVMGQNPRILQSGQTPGEVYLELWGRLTGGQSWHGELLNKRKNGELYWEETHIAPVKDKAGAITHYVAVKIDISERKRIEKILQDNEQRYHLLFDNNPMPMWVIEESSLKFLMVNNRAVEHYGYTREEFSRMTLRDIRPAEDIPELERVISASPDRRAAGEWRHKKKDGAIIHVEIRTVPMKYGDIPARIALIQDITARKLAEKELWDKKQLLEGIIENIPNMIFLKRASDLRFELFNRAGEALLGRNRDELLERNDYDFLPKEQADSFTSKDRAVLEQNGIVDIAEEFIDTPRGTRILHTKKLTIRDEHGQPRHLLGISEDITERKMAEGKIRHLAHYDPLTDLPNRTLFSDRLQQALAIARRDKTRLALMFIDLDKFKPINDELGHHVGDLLLKEVAKRMQDCMRESDTVARIGGDEFVILLPIIEAVQDALLVAEKIREALNRPFVLVGQSLNISSSTGIAVYPEHGGDETQLIRNADVAMYHAKKGGRNRVMLYQPELPDDA